MLTKTVNLFLGLHFKANFSQALESLTASQQIMAVNWEKEYVETRKLIWQF